MSSKAKQRPIWIDLDNSPHVPFFKPIIRKLKEKGIPVQVTARKCYQVVDLLEKFDVEAHVIGRHYGRNKLLKVLGTLLRAFQLSLHSFGTRPACAVSHGSRSQFIASKILRIPSVLITDYEHSQSIPFLHPTLSLVPEVLKKRYQSNSNVKGYPGIKENVYVPEFRPDERILTELNLKTDRIIVTMRPPATRAHYYCRESGELFRKVMAFLCKRSDIQVVILPRDSEQSVWMKKDWVEKHPDKLMIPDRAIDGLNLIWFSDLVISGGGTMNREAAAMGVPVYSIFRGKLGAVDQYLNETDKLVLVEGGQDLDGTIRLVRRERSDGIPPQDSKTIHFIIDAVLEQTNFN
jgi:hypothetical protein